LYSKWRKIDLHIHTDKSKETKPNGNEYKGEFSVDKLLEGLHKNDIEMISLTDHNIINCDAYEEILKKDIKTLVGVEFDICISNEILKNYVYNVYNKTSEKIDNKPFHALVIFKNDNYIEISEKLENMFKKISVELFNNSINIYNNKHCRATTIEYIVKSFYDEDFVIIAHGNKDKGIVEPYKKASKIEDAQYEILIGGISALEMKSNLKMENVINNFNYGFQKLLKDEFKADKTTSYVVFSDNHDCNNYELKDFQTWIKGDLSFETLRLAFSDPESRIYTSLTEPKMVSNYIEGVKIKFHNQNHQEIKFSPQLNVIIGGRSSGKSLLFNTLINMNNCFLPEDKEIFKNNYQRFIDCDNTTAKLYLGDYSKEISIEGEAYCQEKIIKLFEDNASINERLRDEFPTINETYLKEKQEEFNNIIDELNRSYSNYYDVANNIDKGDIQKIIRTSIKNSDRAFYIEFDKLSISDNDQIEVRRGINNIDQIIKLLSIIKNDKVIAFNVDEYKIIDQFSKMLESKRLELDKMNKIFELRKNFYKALKILDDEYIRHELTQEKQLIEEAKNKLNNDIVHYSKYFKAKMYLRQCCEAIEEINFTVDDKIKNNGKYSFITKVDFNVNSTAIKEYLEDTIMGYDKSKSIYLNLLKLADANCENIRIKQHPNDGKTPAVLNNKLAEFIKKSSYKITYEILEQEEDGQVVASTLSTSQGKKASIFLDIKLNSYLKQTEKKVLLIDQVEDNIDNKYISEELVKMLRNLKNRVQIILVTHNPSIAIYGDAENIIIAEQNENRFIYRYGGLENISIREEACKILDGGEIAFKNRMDKYNIENVIYEGEV